MYNLFLQGRQLKYDAKATYDVDKGKFIVKKGSLVSSIVSDATKFRGKDSVLKMREAFVSDRIVTQDVEFKSASTAANFVTGTSTNGMIAWKENKSKKTLKELLQ